MSGMDELSPSDEERRLRRARLTPRLSVDRYLLVWETPLPRDLRRFNPVPPRQAQAVLQHWFRHGSRLFWHRAQRFYCKMRNQPQHELTDFRKSYIERWFIKQLDARMGHLRLLKRKPLEFTGRFAERVPEEHVEDQGPQDELTWIEFVVVDQNGQGVSGLSYEVRLPNDRHAEGRLKRDGSAHYDRLEPGEGTFRLQHAQRASSPSQDEQEAQVVLWNAAAVESKSLLEADWDGCTAGVDIDDEDETGAVMRAVGATDKRPVGLRIATWQAGSGGSSGSAA